MQEAAASCSGVRDLDPDQDPPDPRSKLLPDPCLPLPRRPSFTLELFDRFEQVNSDEHTDDVIMTDITSDSHQIPLFSLFSCILLLLPLFPVMIQVENLTESAVVSRLLRTIQLLRKLPQITTLIIRLPRYRVCPRSPLLLLALWTLLQQLSGTVARISPLLSSKSNPSRTRTRALSTHCT